MSSEKKFLTLKTGDGEEFVVEESAAVLSQTIKNMVEDDCASTTIPVPNIDGKTMSKVIEYCNKHVKESDAKILEEFDKEFVNVDQENLYHLLMAANFLHIKDLLDRACQQVADMIKGERGATSISSSVIAGIASGCAILVLVLVGLGIYAIRQKRLAERAVELSKPFGKNRRQPPAARN